MEQKTHTNFDGWQQKRKKENAIVIETWCECVCVWVECGVKGNLGEWTGSEKSASNRAMLVPIQTIEADNEGERMLNCNKLLSVEMMKFGAIIGKK